MSSLKNDYMERIAKAKTPLDKERLMDEMQRRSRQLESELSKQAEQQKKTLEK
jgi:hypothetical protein